MTVGDADRRRRSAARANGQESAAETCSLTRLAAVHTLSGQGHPPPPPAHVLFSGWVTLEEDPPGYDWQSESLEGLLRAADNPRRRLSDDERYVFEKLCNYGGTRVDAALRMFDALTNATRQFPEIESGFKPSPLLQPAAGQQRHLSRGPLLGSGLDGGVGREGSQRPTPAGKSA